MLKRVKVYLNLTSGKLSLKDCVTGLVLGHCEGVILKGNPNAIVNQKARERVLRERKKYVHAFLEGNCVAVLNFTPYKGRGLTPATDESTTNYLWHLETLSMGDYVRDSIAYNPFKYLSFTSLTTGKAVTSAQAFVAYSDGSMLAYNTTQL